MSIELIKERVIDVIEENFGIPSKELTFTTSFFSELGMDALDFMELIMAFEEEFDMDIDDDDAERLSTIDDVVHYLSQRSRQS